MRELIGKRQLNILQRSSVDEIENIKEYLEEIVENEGEDCYEYGVLGSVHNLIDLIFGEEKIYEECLRRSQKEWKEITKKLRKSEVQ